MINTTSKQNTSLFVSIVVFMKSFNLKIRRYEKDFMMSLSDYKQAGIIGAFNTTSR